VEAIRSGLWGDIDMSVTLQRGCGHPKHVLLKDPLNEMGRDLVVELGHCTLGV